jgi:HSP20 family protein
MLSKRRWIMTTTGMQRVKGTDLISRTSEEIFDQSSRMFDLIAQRAYEIFERRGGSPGYDMEDWLRAESELLRSVPLIVTESNDEYIVLAEVPGFSSKDIEVSVEPRLLAISGKRDTRGRNDEKNEIMIRCEWCADRIFRTLDLPSTVDTAKVTTTLKDGILTVGLPKARNTESMRVELETLESEAEGQPVASVS